MTEQQLKVIRQRVAVGLETHEDARDLADEALRLRHGIGEVLEEARKQADVPTVVRLLENVLR